MWAPFPWQPCSCLCQLQMFPDWGFILVFGAWPPDCYTKRSLLGRWPGWVGHVWRGFDRRVLHCPQMLFHRLGDTKSAFSLSLWISVTFTDDISLLSGALNSVNWEGPKCLFRVARYRSHRGDTSLQVAPVSRAIQIHGEAICIPLSLAPLHTRLRFTQSDGEGRQKRRMAWPDMLLQMPRRLGLCHLHTSPVPVPNEGCNWLNPSRSKLLRQKIPGLGKKSHIPPGPMARVKGPK